MKNLPLMFLVFLSLYGAARADSPAARTAAPKLSATRLTGSGICQVHYDATTRVDRAEMTKSTGSSVLDNEVLGSARRYWRGIPNSTVSVPINYRDAPVLADTNAVLHYTTPLPTYPTEAQFHGEQGSGIVQVVFDVRGKPVYAGMVKSSGSKTLDESTARFAKSHWKSSGGEEAVLTLPVSYHIIRVKPQGPVLYRGSTGSHIKHPMADSAMQAVVTL